MTRMVILNADGHPSFTGTNIRKPPQAGAFLCFFEKLPRYRASAKGWFGYKLPKNAVLRILRFVDR